MSIPSGGGKCVELSHAHIVPYNQINTDVPIIRDNEIPYNRHRALYCGRHRRPELEWT